MEKLIIWAAVTILVLAVFLPYFIKFRRSQKLMAQRKLEAKALGIDRPRAQFPLIDPTLCIGCSSCVEACPEGDVLGVVHGTATIINGERCVGHGYCEAACPVGALKVGLGDVRTRPDIPVMNEYNETNVPGLYIAGELSGLSLIRNAVAQGRMVMEQIAGSSRRADGRLEYDVVIVGAGPAGLSAALTAVMHNLKYLLLDEEQIGGTILHYPHRKMVMTQPVEIPLYGWLKKDEYSKETLLAIWQEIVPKYNILFKGGERAVRVRQDGGNFVVETASGQYAAANVVLALGRRGTPRKLEAPGEELPKVMYRLVDAQSYSGRDLLVVGGGDSAVEAAVGLARGRNNRVYISYRKSAFFRVKKKNETAINELIQAGKVRPLFDSQVVEVTPTGVKLDTKAGRVEIPNDYVFVYIGGVPPFQMLQEMGIAFGGEVRKQASAIVAVRAGA